jgi:hypothetical protein
MGETGVTKNFRQDFGKDCYQEKTVISYQEKQTNNE